MSNTILTKKHFDLSGELHEIASKLVIQTDPADPHGGLKPFVQWSKNSIETLEDAVEKLVQRVRDDTKAGEKVFTRAELAKLNAQYDELKRQGNKRMLAEMGIDNQA
ncbi:MAG TPA: hypothetical protein VHX38_30065 [Pseudonocardiaceae bacterium]|jgi:N12 class adenine-specific DNA methylase|nr:hypothetical protein [Pseudonocardiaceae bacterium]